MGHYPAFICQNGHPISTLTYSCPDKFCTSCGSPIISKCPNCESIIRGHSDGDYGFMSDYEVPAYCHNCGKPYPWTYAAIEATVHMLEESNLSAIEQQKLIEVLPDVICETPRTQLASVRLNNAMAKAESFVADGLKQLIITLGCELIKKQFGL